VDTHALSRPYPNVQTLLTESSRSSAAATAAAP
jgi:hypothetical protein